MADGPWPFSQQNARAIEDHWSAQIAAGKRYFNGAIFIACDREIVTGGSNSVFRATFLKTDFKSYIYWREHQELSEVWDAFGSVILRALGGEVLLGRQSAGNVNSDIAYLPGGFIDKRDVGRDGSIDVDASIARELFEETGVLPSVLQREPGYLITGYARQISIGTVYRSQNTAAELRDSIMGHIASDHEKELSEIIFTHPADHNTVRNLAPYSRALLFKLAQHMD